MRPVAKNACSAQMTTSGAAASVHLPGRQATPGRDREAGRGDKVDDLLCGMRNFGRSRHDSARRQFSTYCLACRNESNGRRTVLRMRSRTMLASSSTQIRSAAKGGAAVFNYVSLLDASRQGEVWSCELLDARTNRTHSVAPARSSTPQGRGRIDCRTRRLRCG